MLSQFFTAAFAGDNTAESADAKYNAETGGMGRRLDSLWQIIVVIQLLWHTAGRHGKVFHAWVKL